MELYLIQEVSEHGYEGAEWSSPVPFRTYVEAYKDILSKGYTEITTETFSGYCLPHPHIKLMGASIDPERSKYSSEYYAIIYQINL